MPDYAEAAEAKGYVKIGGKWSHPDCGAVNKGTNAKPDWQLSPGAKVWYNAAQIWDEDVKIQTRPMTIADKAKFEKRFELDKKAKKD